jgi:amino acid adenylation domain-containing protein
MIEPLADDDERQDEIEDVYELSPMQLGMLFQTLLDPGSGMFVEQQVTPIPGGVGREAFERAWNAVIARTPALRTSFHWQEIEQPVQVVHRRARVAVEELRLPEGCTPAETEAWFAEYTTRRRRQGFDLEHAPLMRIALVRTPRGDTRFVWHFHHILLDGWSAPLVLEEVMREYVAAVTGVPHMARSRRPYRAYIDWLQQQNRAAAERYWRAELEGIEGPTPLGIERVAGAANADDAADAEHTIPIPATESDRLRAFARRHRLTLNTVFQGAWALLLGRYAQSSDVMLGTVVSGRPPALEGVEEMVGLFINTLPVRVRMEPREELLPWLTALQRRQLSSVPHQHASTLDIQRWSGLPRGTRLFDSVLIFENFPVPVTGAPGQADDSADEPTCIGRADVAFSVVVVPGASVRVKFVYDAAAFDAREVERLARRYVTLLSAMADSPHARLCDLSLLSAAERRKLLADGTGPAHLDFDRVPLLTRLTSLAQERPNAVAFVEGRETVTIAALRDRSRRLARVLAREGAARGTVVGVCCERSIEAVVALLAVLECRAAFLPLDPAYPPDRLAYMVADAGASLVIGLHVPVAEARLLDWGTVRREAARAPVGDPFEPATPDDVAYVLYTSGSTGRPKGIAVEHRAVLNRLDWMWREYPFEPGEIGVVKTSMNFVDAFWEALGPLLQGVPSVIAPRSIVDDPGAFVALLADHRVSRIFFVPSFLEVLLEQCPDLGRRLPALRGWWSGGEPLSADLYRHFRSAVPHGTLYNVFGTSEVWDVAVYDPRRDGPCAGAAPLGRPIANVETFVLDGQHQPVPPGLVGTLFVGGAALARGYIGQAALTRERFVPHPFSETPGAHLYDTGDLARVGPTGLIEYVGRRDFQVNLRGFRVEPSEIEDVLDRHASVRESVVVCRSNGSAGQRLLAFVVPTGEPRDTAGLQAHVRASLPAFMVPTIEWIDRIPRTPSGKPDRTRLPDGSTPPTTADAAEDASPLERLIAAQFRDVLGISVVGANDHFFADLGGHSLLATRLVSRLREATGLEVTLRQLFDAPTPAALAATLGPWSPRPEADRETSDLLADLGAMPAAEVEALLASLGPLEEDQP